MAPAPGLDVPIVNRMAVRPCEVPLVAGERVGQDELLRDPAQLGVDGLREPVLADLRVEAEIGGVDRDPGDEAAQDRRGPRVDLAIVERAAPDPHVIRHPDPAVKRELGGTRIRGHPLVRPSRGILDADLAVATVLSRLDARGGPQAFDEPSVTAAWFTPDRLQPGTPGGPSRSGGGGGGALSWPWLLCWAALLALAPRRRRVNGKR